jgi:hypothetical protein
MAEPPRTARASQGYEGYEGFALALFSGGEELATDAEERRGERRGFLDPGVVLTFPVG